MPYRYIDFSFNNKLPSCIENISFVKCNLMRSVRILV